MKKAQAHIIYSGQVQGVGFRFTAQRRASENDLTGWVKNLPTGQVELFAEGSEDAIKEFCGRIDEDFEGYIRDKQIVVLPLADEKLTFHSFRIIH